MTSGHRAGVTSTQTPAGTTTPEVQWREGTVPRGDVDLAVFEAGDPDAPSVVMVHGWPDTHRVWLPVAEHLASVLHVVVYDTRGQGASRTDAPDQAFALPHLAADLLAVIDEVCPSRPVHLVGHDWGSVQGWEAVCEPGAERMIASFTSMSGPNLDHVAAWLRNSLRRPSPARLAGVVAQAASSAYVPFLVSPLAPPVLGALGDRDMVSGLRYYRGNALRVARPPRERRARVPVLQLALTRDPAIRLVALEASDPWCDHLERRRLPLGHSAPVAAPDVVAAEVLGFIQSVEGARGS